ncbi:hypothetical protein [Solimonas marina]|uniref:Uncharacterized protein n=1 Tax=Solimonas marina TaxID=2714601 RepID=A0A969W7Q1_9GAMM|nr:hypothetical protein [Solimonas marina]NKF22157.1 hypothetical protein [Solimonas marina]
MGILKRRRKSEPDAALPRETEDFAFAAEIPVGEQQPLWKVRVQMHSEPQADGERTHLRAHFQTNLASALRPALAHAPQRGRDTQDPAAIAHDGAPRSLKLVERTGHLAQRMAQRALRVPLLRRIAEPLLQIDFNTWIEIQASTASLDRGSQSLLPQADRLRTLGIQPQPAGDEPRAESWAREARDGFAQVSVLQIDKRHLPARLLRLLGDRPFGLAATIVNTAQQKR